MTHIVFIMRNSQTQMQFECLNGSSLKAVIRSCHIRNKPQHEVCTAWKNGLIFFMFFISLHDTFLLIGTPSVYVVQKRVKGHQMPPFHVSEHRAWSKRPRAAFTQFSDLPAGCHSDFFASYHCYRFSFSKPVDLLIVWIEMYKAFNYVV